MRLYRNLPRIESGLFTIHIIPGLEVIQVRNMNRWSSLSANSGLGFRFSYRRAFFALTTGAWCLDEGVVCNV